MKDLQYLLLIIGGFIAPVVPYFIITGFFIFADTCFGIWSAYKLKQEITSTSAARIIYKMVVYNFLILTAYLIDFIGFDKLLGIQFPMLVTRFALVIIAVNELGSIEEKLVRVRGKGKGMWGMIKKVFSVAKFIKEKKDEFYE